MQKNIASIFPAPFVARRRSRRATKAKHFAPMASRRRSRRDQKKLNFLQKNATRFFCKVFFEIKNQLYKSKNVKCLCIKSFFTSRTCMRRFTRIGANGRKDYSQLPSTDEDGKTIREYNSVDWSKWAPRVGMVLGGILLLALIATALGLAIAAYTKVPDPPLILDDPPLILKRTTTTLLTRFMHATHPKTVVIVANNTEYTVQYPGDLTDYRGNTHTVYSNSTNLALQHKVVFDPAANTAGTRCARSTPPTWDKEGLYPVLKLTGPGCFVQWHVVECGNVAVIEAKCVEFCNANSSTCVLPVIESINVTSLFAGEAHVVNGTVETLNSTSASITTLISENIASTVGTFINLTSTTLTSVNGFITTLTSNLVMTNQTMNGVLAHTVSGVIPPTHARQTLQLPVNSNVTAVDQLATMTIGPLPTSGTTSSGQSLSFQTIAGCWKVRDLGADAYTSVSDTVGQRVIQLGDPEVWGGTGTPGTGSQCPAPSSINELKIFSTVAAGTLILRVRSSTELNYDFVGVLKNGVSIYSTSGPGNNQNTDAFKEVTLTVTMLPTDVITINYSPDFVFWGGYDILYFRAEFIASQAFVMTIPANMLQSYVGKDIQICAQDEGTHLLSFDPPSAGMYFDANGEWPVLRFQGTGSEACCITLSFTTIDRIQIKSRDACTVFCDSLSQIHCVDPLRPYETSPLHGWWKGVSKKKFDGPFGFLDASKNPASIKFHGGTINNPTEEISEIIPLYPRLPLTFSSSSSPDITSDYFVYPTVTTFQPGFTQFVQYLGYEKAALDPDMVFFGVFEKVIGATSAPVPLVPISTGTLTDRTPDDPVQMLRNYFDLLLFSYYSTLNADEKWIGFLPAKALLEEIISTGKTHTSPIVETRITMPFNYESLTEFRTENYHHIAPPARIHVTGFTGGCVGLNSPPEGHMVAFAGTNNVPLPSPLFEDYGSNTTQRTVHHKVSVFLDSTGIPVFPNSQVADCPGSSPEISVSYGPITSTTEYLETVGSINYWFYEAIRVGLHVRPFIRFNPFTSTYPSGVSYPSETWSEVQFFLGASPDYELFTRIHQSIGSRDFQSASGFYTTPSAIDWIDLLQIDRTFDRRTVQGLMDTTGRFGIRGDLDALAILETDNHARGTYAYSIPVNNYLEEVAYLAWSTTGTTRTDDVNLLLQIFSPSGEGDEFDAVVVPFGSLPPAGYSYLHQSAPINYFDANYETTTFMHTNLFEQYNMYFGRIKTSLTSGIGNVCYIRMADSFQLDQFYISLESATCPTAACNSSSFRNNAEALVSMYAKMMQYLRVDLACTHIILDIRHNGGGLLQIPVEIGQFIGSDDRVAFDYPFASRTDDGNGVPFDTRSFVYANNAMKSAASDSVRVSPALSEFLYPGSVWQNCEFIFLTDTSAGSAGDVFPNVFLGQNQQGDLGGGVQTRMVGSVDGRNTGYAAGFRLPLSKDSPRLRDYSNAPVSPFTTGSEEGLSFRRTDGTYLANRVPGLEIDYAEASGLAGGNPLWADWDELVYKDLGFVNNTRPVIPGWTGPQTPEAILVTDVISTTIGSNVVTVTMPTPHGFSTGDDIALGSSAIPVSPVGGLSSRVLTGGHIISVTGPTTFTFETSDEGTNYNGPAFVGSIYFGLGTGPDGPSVNFTSPVATSTVSGSGGTFYVMRRSAWRDAWLEQSILSVVANAKKKRSQPRTTEQILQMKERVKQTDDTRKAARRAAKFDLAAANKKHGRNVGCPAGVHLARPSTMPASINITLRIQSAEEANEGTHQREVTRVRSQVLAIVKKELVDGGMCLDSEGRLMATPSCKENPRVVMVRGDAHKHSGTFGCGGKKKTARFPFATKGKRVTGNQTFAHELPEGTTYASCMTACEQTTQVKTKERRMCVLRCGAEFPTHMLNKPSEAAQRRAATKQKRC